MLIHRKHDETHTHIHNHRAKKDTWKWKKLFLVKILSEEVSFYAGKLRQGWKLEHIWNAMMTRAKGREFLNIAAKRQDRTAMLFSYHSQSWRPWHVLLLGPPESTERTLVFLIKIKKRGRKKMCWLFNLETDLAVLLVPLTLCYQSAYLDSSGASITHSKCYCTSPSLTCFTVSVTGPYHNCLLLPGPYQNNCLLLTGPYQN